MSLLTRLTHEFATRLLHSPQYVTQLPCASDHRRAAIYLTFDDGPHPVRTNRILDHLADFGGHATFFAIGRNARRDPRTLRRILDEGHSLGCHTWSHWSARLSCCQDYVEDVHRSRDIMQQITGRPVDLFRPPYGELTPFTLHQLLNDGFRIIHWSRDTRDFEQPSITELQQRFDQQPLTDGDIVLMHDDCAVTSYALDRCLRSWGGEADLRAIPMSSYSVPTQSTAAQPELVGAGPGVCEESWS